MGRSFIFDIETNGLLFEATTIHSLVLRDIQTEEVISCTDVAADGERFHEIDHGLALLEEADLAVGHNVVKYDVPVLDRLRGFKPKGRIRDTLICSRLVWPRDILRDIDIRKAQKGTFPVKLAGRHSLEAFGYRLGVLKGDYGKEDHDTKDGDAWASWSLEMQEYCEQDTLVTLRLWQRILEKGYPETCFDLEHRVAEIIGRQERHGFLFDLAKAQDLYGTLVQRKLELTEDLKQAFPPRCLKDGKNARMVPKRDNARLGYVEGAPFTKVKATEFNPGSRVHIATWLEIQQGWKPTEFTANGQPKVDESVLSQLTYPEARLLSEYLMVEKRLGQLATGDEAWLRHVKDDCRIHGDVNSNGTLTGRMTHSRPNMAQVPSTKAPYGEQCRALFTVPHGKRLVGCDADALELCCLAGYMARYDNGAYIKVVLEGDKSQGTDIHSVNARALGLDPKKKYLIDGKNVTGRDIAKVWFYAFIYGAGDAKLGFILGVPQNKEKEARRKGKDSRARFLKNLPALKTLTEKVKKTLKDRGHLKGLDGRRLHPRSDHSSLNTLLQSAGAVIMKVALVIADDALQAEGFIPGRHYEFVANVHDEFQIEADTEIAERVGQLAKDAIRLAGEHLSFACPLSGSYDVGANWADTH